MLEWFKKPDLSLVQANVAQTTPSDPNLVEIPLLEAEEMEVGVVEVDFLEEAEAHREMAHCLNANSVANLATLFGNATIGSIKVFRIQLALFQILLNLHQLLFTTQERTLPLLPPFPRLCLVPGFGRISSPHL